MVKLVTKENKFLRLVKAPIRALAKARDFYVNKMIMCAGYYGDGFGPVDRVHAGIPRTLSSVSSRSTNADEDLQELIRASSTKMLAMRGVVNDGVVMRSQSVGLVIGRIDEDKACDFVGEFVEIKVHKYPRSTSCAVPRRTMGRKTGRVD